MGDVSCMGPMAWQVVDEHGKFHDREFATAMAKIGPQLVRSAKHATCDMQRASTPSDRSHFTMRMGVRVVTRERAPVRSTVLVIACFSALLRCL